MEKQLTNKQKKAYNNDCADSKVLFLIHDVMTDIHQYKNMTDNLKADISSIIVYVQNIMLHQHWAARYGVIVTEEKKVELDLKSMESKLALLADRGYTHVSSQLPLDHRIIGICRDFSVAGVSFLREANIPARARCGFASYFEEGKWSDHWVIEYWNGSRWVMADAQLDDLQQKQLETAFDPQDVSEQEFLSAANVWQRCRSGQANPELFGIFEWWGYEYIVCNLLLDVNSLLGMPMHPWDHWDGYKSKPIDTWTEDDYALMDELSECCLSIDELNGVETLRQFAHRHTGILVQHAV